jgi:hypothetical protein
MSFKTYVDSGSDYLMSPVTSPGGGQSGGSGWTPSVLYMLALVVAEVLFVGWLTTKL